MRSDEHQPGLAETTPFEKILRALQAMHKTGKFQATVLASAEGLPIITVPANYDSDVAATIVAMVRQVSDRAQSQLGMAEMDEVKICDHDHTRLVCRYLPAEREGLILAVMVPRGRSYRRVTNQAVKQIKRLLY